MDTDRGQFGGSAIKVGEEEFHLFRDYEYVVYSSRSVPYIPGLT